MPISFTFGIEIFWPRPFFESGFVTIPTILNLSSISLCRDIAEKSSVPKNMIELSIFIILF